MRPFAAENPSSVWNRARQTFSLRPPEELFDDLHDLKYIGAGGYGKVFKVGPSSQICVCTCVVCACACAYVLTHVWISASVSHKLSVHLCVCMCVCACICA